MSLLSEPCPSIRRATSIYSKHIHVFNGRNNILILLVGKIFHLQPLQAHYQLSDQVEECTTHETVSRAVGKGLRKLFLQGTEDGSTVGLDPPLVIALRVSKQGILGRCGARHLVLSLVLSHVPLALWKLLALGIICEIQL